MSCWINYHSHTNYCDGSHAPVDYIKEAIRMKQPAYGYSSHAPVPFKTNWNISDENLTDYLQDINTLKATFRLDIQVYLGLEIDFIPGIAGRRRHILKDIPLDYFIGSIHFVDSFKNGEHWNIDTSPELFKKGWEGVFNKDSRKAVTRFWEITRQMIQEERPPVIGHLDKIKMFNKHNCYFSEQDSWYRDQVEITLDLIKANNSIVEINTRGYYRYCQPDLYPGEWIISKLVEKDIPLMINSDAHEPSEITSGMTYASHKLRKLGVTKLAALIDGNWNEFSYSEKGLKLY